MNVVTNRIYFKLIIWSIESLLDENRGIRNNNYILLRTPRCELVFKFYILFVRLHGNGKLCAQSQSKANLHIIIIRYILTCCITCYYDKGEYLNALTRCQVKSFFAPLKYWTPGATVINMVSIYRKWPCPIWRGCFQVRPHSGRIRKVSREIANYKVVKYHISIK